jgi:hypothetical protein
MAMTLKPVHPSRGAHWVRDGWRLFLKRPVALTAPYALFIVLLVLSLVFGVAGVGLMVVALPLFGLGYMVACQSVLLEGKVSLGHFIEPLRPPGQRRGPLLGLCLLFGALILLSGFVSSLIAGDTLARLVQLTTTQGTPQAEVDALLADRSLLGGVIAMGTLTLLISMVFWHAPALVYWGQQSVAQSLFSSAVAVWRSRGAFVVYGLTLLGVGLVLQLGVAALHALLGPGLLLSLASSTAGMAYSAVFYTTLVFTFNDSFGTQ